MGTVVCDGSWDSVFPVELIPALFKAVCRAWRNVGFFPSDALEDKITRKLIVQMRLEVRRDDLRVAIHSQYELLESEGEVIGKIDIVIDTGPTEKVYFSFECKRLNVDFPSGFRPAAGDYCDKGIMRYVNEQYAPGLGRGGMLGYVMDGRCEAAINAVSSAVAGRRETPRLQHELPLQASSVLTGCPRARDSHHKTVTDEAFTIHHLFVAVESN
jgi:hypothetical protein